MLRFLAALALLPFAIYGLMIAALAAVTIADVLLRG